MNHVNPAYLRSLWCAAFMCLASLVFAQEVAYPCAASEMQRALFQKDSTLLKRQQALDEDIQQHLLRQAKNPVLRSAAVVTIPVVVHVIHQNGTENINDAQVQSALQHLNDAFAHQGYYGASGTGTSIPIQFCLAQRTPDNLPSNGITRDVSALTEMNMETQDAALKKLSRWDAKEYVNIWVVRDINSTAYGAGVAGYAYYASAHGLSVDGVVCEARYFGSSPANDVVLIHEIGHYLNLYHTFEGGCTNNQCDLEGDRVCDTPPDQAKHTGCLYNSCSTDAADSRTVNPLKSDVNDLTENYLDYSPFSCQHAFTPGQSARMLAALQTVRSSLLESSGCLPPCTQVIAADIVVPSNIVVGSQVAFKYNGSGATQYEWKLNGTVFSNQQNPNFTFSQPGSYTLEVYARNADPNCGARKKTTIVVLCNVVADFTPKLSAARLGDLVTFTSTSSGATKLEWSVNGVVVGTGNTYSQTFSAGGDYNIQLKASNTTCSTISYGRVIVNRPCGDTVGQDYPCIEICDNGVDDNGNGLIDCADPACRCSSCLQLPDGVIGSVDSIQCLGDSLRVSLTICNRGKVALRSTTPIAFYASDPTLSNAVPLAKLQTLGVSIPPDTCLRFAFVIKAQSGKPIFAVLNDNYKRPRPYTLERFLTEENPECSFANNKIQFQFDYPMVPKIDLGPDLQVCSNSVTVLKATKGFTRYRWSDGSNDTTFTAFYPGVYWLDAWDACGNIHTDSVRLNLQPNGIVDLGPDRQMCKGDSLAFSVKGFDQVKWWPISGLKCSDCTDQITRPDSSILYYVTARTGNCITGDSIRIIVQDRPKIQILPVDTLNCTRASVQLSAQVTPVNSTIQWLDTSNLALNTNAPNVSIPGKYTITARLGMCSSTDSVTIALEKCNQFAVYVPNALSQSSTMNGLFHPFFSKQAEISGYQFEIYDRWGEQVFRSIDPQESWDGRKQGRLCQQGVYVWKLWVRYSEEDKTLELLKAGDVTVLR